MTAPAPAEPRSSRALPLVVAALFAVVLLADLAVVAFYGHDRNLFEEDRVEVAFRPHATTAPGRGDGSAELAAAGRAALVDSDGNVLVERTGERLVVRAGGELVIRFRVVDAGATLELDYRFLDPGDRGRCEVAVGRLVNSHGVDVVRRLRLAAARRPRGTFRHDLADHVGWFELRLDVNGAAARDGLEVLLPRIVRD